MVNNQSDENIVVEEIQKPKPQSIYGYNSMDAALLNKRLIGMTSRLVIPVFHTFQYFWDPHLTMIRDYIRFYAIKFHVTFKYFLNFLLTQTPHYPEYKGMPTEYTALETNLVTALAQLNRKGVQLPDTIVEFLQHIVRTGPDPTSEEHWREHAALYTLYLQYMKQLIQRWGKLFTPEAVVMFFDTAGIEPYDTEYPIKLSNDPQSNKQALYHLYHIQRLAAYFVLYYEQYITDAPILRGDNHNIPITLSTIIKLPHPPETTENYKQMHFVPRAFLRAAGGVLAYWLSTKGYKRTYINVLSLGEALRTRTPTWRPLNAEEPLIVDHMAPDVFHQYFKDTEPVMKTLNDVVIDFVEFFKNLEPPYIDLLTEIKNNNWH